MKRDRRTILRNFVLPIIIVIIAVLFQQRFPYRHGLLYITINCLWIIIAFWLRRPLPQETTRHYPKQNLRVWERRHLCLTTILQNLTLITALWEAANQAWRPAMSWTLTWLGILLFTTGQSLFLWSQKANPFFFPTFQIKLNSDHYICSTGPYKIIRHPGYLGGALFHLAAPLLLGSFLALIPAFLFVLLLAVKTYNEDQALRFELPGYLEYINQVPYRWLPGFW